MQTVSADWLANQEQLLVDESFIEIYFGITDPDAVNDATASDNDHVFYSNSAQIVDGLDKYYTSYATLEHNIWALDGNYFTLPDASWGDTGYVSGVLCDDTGIFIFRPAAIVSFSQVHTRTIPGITVTWSKTYDEYAVDFIVTAYNGTSVVASKTVTGNEDIISIVEVDIQNYNRIVVEITKWCLPYHRARIEDIFVGIGKLYRKKDLVSYTHEMVADPLTASLPKYSVTYEIDNTNDDFDPNNMTGLTKYLIERQRVNVRYGWNFNGEMEWIPGGSFFLSEWKSKQDGITATFVARDLLEFLTATFYKGLYSPGGVSLYDLAEQVLMDAGLPLHPDGNVNWSIDESLRSIFTIAPLPEVSLAICLQYIANAACCVLRFDRTGRLFIEPPSNSVSAYDISLFNSFGDADITVTKPLAGVNVKVYKFFADMQATYNPATGGINGYVEAVSEVFRGGVVVDGTQMVVLRYSQAAKEAQAALTGGTLVSAVYYTYACELTITGSGNVDVVITGKRLQTSDSEVTIMTGVPGDMQPVVNPLITSVEQANTVGTHTCDYLRSRIILSTDWRADPRLDALDITRVENEYSTQPVHMTTVKYQYNGGFHGTGEGRVRPEYADQIINRIWNEVSPLTWNDVSAYTWDQLLRGAL